MPSFGDTKLIAGVILAAGKSERMGSPKALLEYEGSTFLARILRTIDECTEITHRVIVVGRHAREIAARVESEEVVFNPDYAQGMTSSFQAGIKALPKNVSRVLVFLVDHPMVRSSTVRALLARADGTEVVVPVCEGRRGHPVVFSRSVMSEIMRLPIDQGVNSIVRSDSHRVVEVPVKDPGVLLDIDTPEDFSRLSL